MSELEAFLDETPGETRGVVVRNGREELHPFVPAVLDAAGAGSPGRR